MTSTITVERRVPGSRGVPGLAALPSLRGMTPAEARAAQVLGMAWEPAEIVELAIEWVGDGRENATLVDLAGRDWDDPALPVLWDLALDELGAAHPAASTARRRVAAYLARRGGRRHGAPAVARVPAPRCPHCAAAGTPA
jgi:hypothetical protein